jgi:hypothetical protein
MNVELFNPQAVIFEELAGRKCTQRGVAITYAYILRQESQTADWPKINQAITERWSKAGLVRVKEMAWKFAFGR